MNCLTENMLRAYHDGELTGASRAEAEIHLSACDRCREQLERVSEMARRVQGRLKSLDTSDSGMAVEPHDALARFQAQRDRKSTRLNSSHTVISYAVFCLKKKKKKRKTYRNTAR